MEISIIHENDDNDFLNLESKIEYILKEENYKKSYKVDYLTFINLIDNIINEGICCNKESHDYWRIGKYEIIFEGDNYNYLSKNELYRKETLICIPVLDIYKISIYKNDDLVGEITHE